MAVRAFNPRYSLFSSPIPTLSSPLRLSSSLHHRHTILRSFPSLPFPSHPPFFSVYGLRSRSIHSLFDSVMEELQAIRKRRKIVSNASKSNMGLLNEELVEDRVVNRSLQKGLLLELKGDSDKILLVVSQRPDGKRKWMVSDQVLVETT